MPYGRKKKKKKKGNCPGDLYSLFRPGKESTTIGTDWGKKKESGGAPPILPTVPGEKRKKKGNEV